ncbi:hypothetical protein PIB30_105024 [Stylosanthes scabra]|uniref:Uncharacterized protein n=1 Tax=Stylosanthes scabra TaxID=79078 RepID=A0ABU6SZ62_9FABA|nr:hypothetical protein [Stylosanthes scabra]
MSESRICVVLCELAGPPHLGVVSTPMRAGNELTTPKCAGTELTTPKRDRKEEAVISPIPAGKEKKKKDPIAYMPKPPYPQRLKVENKNKAPKKEPKEEKDATNDSMKFKLIQKVPYLPTIIGSSNKTYMITKGVDNKFFEPP